MTHSLITGFNNIFTLNSNQKFALFFFVIFVITMLIGVWLEVEIAKWANRNGITWKKMMRPVAYVALLMIAVVEALGAAWNTDRFKTSLQANIREVHKTVKPLKGEHQNG